MNPMILIVFLGVGACASSYGQSQINVRVEDPTAFRSSYAAPQQVYSAPASRSQDSYSSSYDSQPTRQQIPILRFNQDIRGSLSNNVEFETGNGIRSSMNTQVVPGNGGEYINEEGRSVQSDSVLEQSGHSYHEAPEGGHISLTWSAGLNGFHATGDHLPRPVEMPAEHAEAHRQALAAVAAAAPSSSSYSSGAYSAPAMRSGY